MNPSKNSISLPLDSLIPSLITALETKPNLILQASPGSGKTTRVPPALLKCSFLSTEQEIWVLEPRRMAAKYTALRIAEEMGEEVGQTVGYQFRFESKTSPKTRIRFLTEGMFMRFFLKDPSLSRVGIVILDEFHERHLQTDTALNALRNLQLTRRPELRIVVMSATLSTESLSRFLSSPSEFNFVGEPHPLSIEYLNAPSQKPLEIQVRDAVTQSIKNGSSEDILVFLPGKQEILRTLTELNRVAQTENRLLLPLYGELSKEEQDLAIRPNSRRKIVLSTNIAETSLTIYGVNTVIDSGLERQASFSWWTGIPALKTRSVSKASAIQRAGRAARTGPGACYRLFTKADFESRPSYTLPEIFRADLSQVVLELKSLGVQDLSTFAWFEAPSKDSLVAAEEVLYLLGALSPRGGPLTEMGSRMSQIPTPPRISRLLIEAEALSCLESALYLSAMLTEGVLDQLDAMECLTKKPSFLVSRSLKQLERYFPLKSSYKDDPQQLSKAVLRGFPDRVAKRKEMSLNARQRSHQVEFLFCAGGTAEAPETAFTLANDFFVALSVQETGQAARGLSKTVARSFLPIEDADLMDLNPSLLSERQELSWDKTKRKVSSVSLLSYGQIVLEERESLPPCRPDTFAFFLKEATGTSLEQILNWNDWVETLGRFQSREQMETLLGRLLLISNSQNPPIEPAFVAEKLSQFPWEAFSFDYFSELDWTEVLSRIILNDHAHLLNLLAPSQLVLPNGRKATITYPLNRAPWIESRLQDFFGMRETPTVLSGKIPVTVHLLAPNYRAVQVTQDLTGFWKNHYPEIRKELSRKYPKHSWPEDPTRPLLPKTR